LWQVAVQVAAQAAVVAQVVLEHQLLLACHHLLP
jgi:hypothetical protein